MATERVGRYQLLEPIGTGPCGTVSRAKVFGVAGFERQFAVKRFHPELTITTALAQNLSAAARAYGSLEHPRIARMSEFGVAQGQTFTAVEFVAGLDAARLVAEARLAGVTLAAGGALALVSQAARAVGYAHGRGLTHLGLAPTNVIVTADGDIKITDFAILAAGLPQRPIDVARLQYRIQYLAPEQVANEATSAATDVFALGVIAYELVTGQRTFRGETAQQIAQSIMAGPPPEPQLPRPIVRVLQRCLARSTFERFPDARAVADALDAALRVAPVPGTRKDIGAQVKETQERLAALHDGEMSGMVALNVGTGPIRREPVPEIATLGRDSNPNLEVSTREFVRPDVHVPGPAPLIGPSSTMPEMPKPMTTMTGLAPPPTAVPQGVSSGLAPPAPAGQPGSGTLLGIANAKVLGTIPLIKAQRPAEPVVPRTMTPPPLPRAPGNEDLEMEMLFGNEGPGLLDPTMPGIGAAPPRAKRPSDLPTSEMSPLLADALGDASMRGTTEVEPLIAEAFQQDAMNEFPHEQHVSKDLPSLAPAPPVARYSSPITQPGTPPPPAKPSSPVLRPVAPPPVLEDPATTLGVRKTGRPGSRAPVIVALGLLAAAGLGFAAWQVYQRMNVEDDATVVRAPGDAKTPAVAAADAATAVASADAGTTVDAATAVATTVDAAVVAVADAGKTAAPDAATAAGASDSLTITSTPAGALVYLDGSETGVTPLKLPASADRHTVALLLAGHELYIAQVDGAGAFAIPLKEVTPPGGPAGIKVLRCKDKDRYYVFVDGKPTGQMCPTERIDTDVGPHTVEVYDAVTETRKKFDIVVRDTRLSVRVKIE
jgi:serine/threonine-protein kinase